MNPQKEKCVMVLDESLPLGVLANTAAILGVTLGKQLPEIVGRDVRDRSGREHLGIIELPVPVLRAPAERLRELRETLYGPEYQDLTVADFSGLAQSCGTYDEFTGRMKEAEDLRYFGLAICGEKKKVNRLTGSMPLLR